MLVYHRTNWKSANEIIQSGIMKTKEYALFFSNRKEGYAEDYGNCVISFEIPKYILEVDDEFSTGEKHYRMSLKKDYKNVSSFNPKIIKEA